ncbi:hypothetical protein BWL06_12480 [Lactiplantibacillus plantarum]|nr:hypothetical protein BWL06_12480 [Lactiplantibacillus plantarum]
MKKIYRKTATIRAEQFNYEKWVYMRQDAYPMVFGDTAKDGGMMATNPLIKTLEGNMKIKDNDWIATGVNGEHWPIADDVFKQTYAELPVIPEEVAYVIKQAKKGDYKLGWVFYAAYTKILQVSVCNWIKTHAETFARAWLDGYAVEGDK